MQSDHNLLYGILALNADLISQDQMVEAMLEWVKDKSRPIGSILEEKGHLQPEDRVTLDNLMQQRLKKFDNDVEKTLSTVATPSELRDKLDRIEDPDLCKSLSFVDEGPEATVAPTMDLPKTSVGARFQVLRFLAKGGLGQVSVARDNELHREVALKEILSKNADRMDARDRFVLEAELTGGLEHPGIVPVYGLGQSEDGRPYYAMKLIKGESLRRTLKVFRAAKAKPDGRIVEFHKLLRRFAAICEAVHYAHSRGVLHRDLKPDNIMLGEYGETLVVDWGLAKLDDSAVEIVGGTSIALRPPASSKQLTEREGSGYGTPGYMAPEQAAGDSARIGVCTDVYGLGSILYEILTGRAPIQEGDPQSKMEMARRGEFPKPREVSPATPKPLEAICIKAMALRPEDRYDTAISLAEDVQQWLADEPVSAYPESRQERLSRWMRKNSARVRAVVQASLVVMVVLALAAQLINNARRNEKKAKNLAVENFRNARDAVDTWLTGLAVDMDGYAGFTEFREHLLRSAVADYKKLADQPPSDYPQIELERARTHLRLGDFLYRLAKLDEATEAFNQASEILASGAAKLPNDVSIHPEQANAHRGLGKVAVDLGNTEDAEAHFKSATTIMKAAISKLARTDPNRPIYQRNLGNCLADRAQMLISKEMSTQAESILREALSAHRAAFESDGDDGYRDDLARVLRMLGQVLTDREAYDQAETLLQEAIAYAHQLTTGNRGQLSYVLAQGEASEDLALLQMSRGRLADALDVYQSVTRAYKSVVGVAREIPLYREAAARVENQIGLVLHRLGRTTEADPRFQAAVEGYDQLVKDFGVIPRYRLRLAAAQASRGQLLSELGREQQALGEYRSAVDLLTELEQKLEPNWKLESSRRLAICNSHQAQIYQKLGNTDDAASYFLAAIQRLDAILPQQPHARDDLAQVQMHVARLLVDLPDEVAAYQQGAEENWQELLKSSQSPEYRHNFARALIMGLAPTQDAIATTVAMATQAVTAVPNSANYAGTLGAAYYRQEDYKTALEWLDKASDLRESPSCFESFFAAMCEFELENVDEARKLLASANDAFQTQFPGNLAYQQLQREATETVNAVKDF